MPPDDGAGIIDGAAEAAAEAAEADPTLANDNGSDVPETEGGDTPTEPDTVEIEHDGQKYQVPKALREAFLRQADYTQKTQTVAEQRRAVEAERQQFAQAQQAHQAYIKEIAQVVSINDALAQYERVDWNALRAQNPQQAQAAYMEYQQLKDARDRAVQGLRAKDQERTQLAQRDLATRIEQTAAFARENIPDWTPELDRKIEAFARDLGFSSPEIQSVLSPKVYRLLHLARIGHEVSTKAKAATKPPVQQAAAPQPVRQVAGGKGGPSGAPSDKDDYDTWLRKREAQIAAKRRR